MKIDSGAAQQAYAAYRSAVDPARTSGQGTPSAADDQKVQRRDHADISAKGRLQAQALDTVRSTTDTRDNLVTSLRDRIKAGTYKVDDQRLADHITKHFDIGS